MAEIEDYFPDVAVNEVMYRTEVEIEGVGRVKVETVNFPPYPDVSTWTDEDWNNEDNYSYDGFESGITLPDGTSYGNGPEVVGEGPAQLHAAAVAQAVETATRKAAGQ